MDVMDFVRHANKRHQKPEFMPLGAVLTWAIVKRNVFVNEVTIDDGMMGL